MVRAAAEPAIKSPAVMNVVVNNVLHRIIASTYSVVHAHTLVVGSKSFRTKVKPSQLDGLSEGRSVKPIGSTNPINCRGDQLNFPRLKKSSFRRQLKILLVF